MPTTSNRGYEVPTHGSEVDTWDVPLNENFDLMDKNLGAVSSISLTNVNVTLSAGQYACGTIRLSGTLTGNVLVLFPNVSGWWTVENRCTGNFYVAARLVAGGDQIGLPPGEAIDVFADGTNMNYRGLGRVGTYEFDCGTTVPLWVSASSVPPYLICDGSTFNAGVYPFLNTKLGGNTLPDFRGRMWAALNGGTGRITTAGSGIDGDTRRSAGGAQTVTLTTDQLPAHSHSITDPGHTHPIPLVFTQSSPGGTGGRNLDGATTFNTDSSTTGITGTNATGSGAAINKMPPTTIGGIVMIRAA